MTKFNVGQKVVITRKGKYWNRSGLMDKWLGKTVTIKRRILNAYEIEEDKDDNPYGGGWLWDGEDLEPTD